MLVTSKGNVSMKLRVARHTGNLHRIVDFYQQVLGLQLLGSFEGHSSYDGAFLGLKGQDWHLEFTVSDTKPLHNTDEDDILVFYFDTKEEYMLLKQRFKDRQIPQITPKNPYWQGNGTMYADPDGFYVILSVLIPD